MAGAVPAPIGFEEREVLGISLSVREPHLLLWGQAKPIIATMYEVDHSSQQGRDANSLESMQSLAAAHCQAILLYFGQSYAEKRVQLLCGSDNFGGIGAALAEELSRAGVRTDVVKFGSWHLTSRAACIYWEVVRTLAAFEASSSRLSLAVCTGPDDWSKIREKGINYDVVVDAFNGIGRLAGTMFSDVGDYVSALRDQGALNKPQLLISIQRPAENGSQNSVTATNREALPAPYSGSGILWSKFLETSTD